MPNLTTSTPSISSPSSLCNLATSAYMHKEEQILMNFIKQNPNMAMFHNKDNQPEGDKDEVCKLLFNNQKQPDAVLANVLQDIGFNKDPKTGAWDSVKPQSLWEKIRNIYNLCHNHFGSKTIGKLDDDFIVDKILPSTKEYVGFLLSKKLIKLLGGRSLAPSQGIFTYFYKILEIDMADITAYSYTQYTYKNIDDRTKIAIELAAAGFKFKEGETVARIMLKKEQCEEWISSFTSHSSRRK